MQSEATHDNAALGLHPHALQALGVAADLVHGDAGRQFLGAVVEFAAIGEHLAHHGVHVGLAERNAQHLVAHAAAGGVGHLGVLDMIARIGEQVVIAGMVPMHVGGDDVLDLVGFDAERLEPLADRMGDLARALLGRGFVEAGVDRQKCRAVP